MKKLISILLSLALMLTIGISAAAEPTVATLTIQDISANIEDQTVTVKFSLSGCAPITSIAIANIAYDTDSLELVSGVWSLPTGHMMLNNYALIANTSIYSASAVYQNPTEISGDIFVLTLKAKNGVSHIDSSISCNFSVADKSGTLEATVEAGNVAMHYGGEATCNTLAVCDDCNQDYGELNSYNHTNLTTLPAKAATCSKTGLTAGKKCLDCDTVTIEQTKVQKKQHTQKETLKKATLTADGSIKYTCKACGTTTKTTEKIYKIQTVKLSDETFTYTGNNIKPKVTVKNSKNKTIAALNYTVKYPSSTKNVGTYKVTVKFNGDYSGSKNLSFVINPKSTSVTNLTAGRKAFTVKWNKQTSSGGYQIQYSTNSSFKSAKSVNISNNKASSKTVTKLTPKKKYYVRIRTFKKVSGKTYYSDWSAKKNVTTKK